MSNIFKIKEEKRKGRRRMVGNEELKKEVEEESRNEEIKDLVGIEEILNEIVDEMKEIEGNRKGEKKEKMRKKKRGIIIKIGKKNMEVLDKIKFVERDERRKELEDDEIGDMKIMILKRNGRIEKDDEKLRKEDGEKDIGKGKILEILMKERIEENEWGIEKIDIKEMKLKIGGDGIESDERLRKSKKKVLKKNSVDESGIEWIGEKENGDEKRIGGVIGRNLLRIRVLNIVEKKRKKGGRGEKIVWGLIMNIIGKEELIKKKLKDRVEKIRNKMEMIGGNREGLEKEKMEWIVNERLREERLRIVGEKKKWIEGKEKRLWKGDVRRSYERIGVDEEEKGVRIDDWRIGMGENERLKDVIGRLLKKRSINEMKIKVVEIGIVDENVECEERKVIKKRKFEEEEEVEKSGIEEIRKKENGESEKNEWKLIKKLEMRRKERDVNEVKNDIGEMERIGGWEDILGKKIEKIGWIVEKIWIKGRKEKRIERNGENRIEVWRKRIEEIGEIVIGKIIKKKIERKKKRNIERGLRKRIIGGNIVERIEGRRRIEIVGKKRGREKERKKRVGKVENILKIGEGRKRIVSIKGRGKVKRGEEFVEGGGRIDVGKVMIEEKEGSEKKKGKGREDKRGEEIEKEMIWKLRKELLI